MEAEQIHLLTSICSQSKFSKNVLVLTTRGAQNAFHIWDAFKTNLLSSLTDVCEPAEIHSIVEMHTKGSSEYLLCKSITFYSSA